jgi:hypothetical protein
LSKIAALWHSDPKSAIILKKAENAMEQVYMIIGAGIAATAIMSLFLSFVHRKKIANTDMVRALGSVFTGELEDALMVGSAIHICSGIFFAFVYSLLLAFGPVFTDIGVIMVCSAAGFFHGLVMTMLLVIAVAEHHPIKKFRKVGIDVTVSYLFAHVVYGLCLGVALTILGFNPQFLFPVG